MPEGHTLLRLARELTQAFGGRPVRVSSPQGRFAADAALVDGALCIGAESAGKHLFIELAGMVSTGSTTGGTAYADLRGATQCDLIGGERRAQIVAQLGEDPLRPDADPERAWRRISRSARPIGDLLMDQTVVAGVGNVYRAEILFRHRIHPLRPGRTLRRTQFLTLWADLVELMEYGVRTGRIDTVRPEHSPEAMGRPARQDDHGGEVYVYRRQGQPCLVCGSRVRTDVLVGRNSFWCARCQPVFRSRAVG
ncbi:MAG: Fpg/Nei family DNA glycosylase [Propionibacteriales bacterium]|nr:Fpg/Nei family DNA glycosylase [Propionibacteriales bacterium]